MLAEIGDVVFNPEEVEWVHQGDFDGTCCINLRSGLQLHINLPADQARKLINVWCAYQEAERGHRLRGESKDPYLQESQR